MSDIQQRLEYLRGELRAERISYGELSELQGLASQIDPSDVELLEAAGVPEFPEQPDTCDFCGQPLVSRICVGHGHSVYCSQKCADEDTLPEFSNYQE